MITWTKGEPPKELKDGGDVLLHRVRGIFEMVILARWNDDLGWVTDRPDKPGWEIANHVAVEMPSLGERT
jgi:hypothetical protein